jgi:hypothetical protein
MDDLFGVTELVKEKVHGDEEAHHKPMEIHESTATAPAANGTDKRATGSHIEDKELAI